MSHISQINSTDQVNPVPLEAESPEVHLIRKVCESVGIEIQEDIIYLYQRETELALETDYDLLLTILEESDDETELKGALVHLALKAFKGDLGASDILVEYYVKGPQRDFPKAIYFFKIAMQYHTWDMNQYPLIDSILITVVESMFKNARTPEERNYLHEVEAILADYANKGFSDVKFHLALLYLLGGAVPQNLDRAFQYFQELWAVDLRESAEVQDEKNETDFFLDLLLTKIMDLAKRGNEQAKQVIAQIAELETTPQRQSFFQVLNNQFHNPRFSDVETLDHNPDYLHLIGDLKKLKKLADAGNPKACLYTAESYFEAAGDSETEEIKRAYLCTAIDGGELEALVHLFYNLDSLDDQMLCKFQNWLGDDFTIARFEMLKDICSGNWAPELLSDEGCKFAAREAYNQHHKAKEIYQKEVLDEQDKKRADQFERDAYLFARVAVNFAGSNESATFTLAEIYAEGRVVERNLEKAFGLYFEAMGGIVSERIHDFAPNFLRSDKNSPFDEAARLAAIVKLEALAETCNPGERGVHFTLGCIALQDEQNFEKALSYFRFAVSAYLFVPSIRRLLTFKGSYEKVAFRLIEESVARAKAGDLRMLNDVMLVALCSIEEDAMLSGYFYKLINDLLSSSLVSLEAGEPYALVQVYLIKEKLSPITLKNLEPEYIKKALYAVENLYDVALTGDRKAFIQYYHYYEERGYVDAPGGNIEEIIENVSLPDRRLAHEGDLAALSNFISLINDCPGIERCSAFQKSLNLIIANLISYLVPHIQNGQRDFGDLLTIIQMLDEKGMSFEDVHNVAIELAEGNHELHLRLGFFYARTSKSQNIERAKLCLEDAFVLTGHRVEDREALVQLYLESPVEMRGRYALCFLASYYLGSVDI
ncbi:MAG: hypothetical protein KBF71_02195 [Alphaproteobacteria bacterium]|nr:hypothetical protein [Alphaproteobacteria bacterium]